MEKSGLTVREFRYNVIVSALSHQNSPHAVTHFGTDVLTHARVEKEFSGVISDFQQLMKNNPYSILVEIYPSNEDEESKHLIFELFFRKDRSYSVKGWNLKINLNPLNKTEFEHFLLQQTYCGFIELALERKDKEMFFQYTEQLQPKN